MNEEILKYAKEHLSEFQQFLREFLVIPAPSHHEERRAAFVKAWMEKKGAENVEIDAALNVVYRYNVTDTNDLKVFMAHTDIVFPEETVLEIKEEGTKWYCPGIGDDGVRLAALLFALAYFLEKRPKAKYGILFVANSCEEGLGNLKGSRHIVDEYGDRIKEFVTFDGNIGSIVNRAAGSHRYEVTVKAQGGHSWGNFGNTNAIAEISKLIAKLYEIEVPKIDNVRTTYNVGHIEGGRTVNTIAQEAKMLYEYRSNGREGLQYMKEAFEKTVADFRGQGMDITVELLGERPCNGDLDPEAFEALIRKAAETMEEFGYQAKIVSGSTDANYPLSKGIPAICAGNGVSGDPHKLSEWTDSAYFEQAIAFAITLIAKEFEV